MIAIRKAVKEDFPRLIEIMDKSADREELKGFVPPEDVTQRFLVQLKRRLGLVESGVLVAEINREPVGFAFFSREDDCFEIEEIDVVKEYQGQGIGKALLNKIERLARDRGVTSLVTGTSVNSEGKPWKAYGFWIRMGYKDTGERRDSGYGFKYCKLVKRL